MTTRSGLKLNRIKAVLADCGVKGKELANQLGVSENTISSWCQNHTQPSLVDLHGIAINLEVSICELLIEHDYSVED